MFSGSYLDSDVEFLLKKIDIQETDVKTKEENIQNKNIHYSEMISQEYVPTKEYLDIFYQSLENNIDKFATDIFKFSQALKNRIDNKQKDKNIALVSLARAGTPIGVLIKRTLKNLFNLDLKHYSISIIRDREIDQNALLHILKSHKDSEILFIDGWTGKGVINRELKKFISEFNQKYNQNISSDLFVIADISGKADFSVTNEDYLIPSSALNSTVSGLVSRTILNRNFISDTDFHGCKFYSEFKNNDLSLWFVDEVSTKIKKLFFDKNIYTKISFLERDISLEKKVEKFLKQVKIDFNILDINHIKPGIAETTRVLLRRVPDLIIVKDLKNQDTTHLQKLAFDKNVKLIEINNLPYTSVGIIKNLKK